VTFAAQRFLEVARELVEPREHAVFGRALSLFTGFCGVWSG
jgi:hypothetical protein